jgi:hypothetical protein
MRPQLFQMRFRQLLMGLRAFHEQPELHGVIVRHGALLFRTYAHS